jgi:hypothetical protein
MEPEQLSLDNWDEWFRWLPRIPGDPQRELDKAEERDAA